jgi:hypothetical protein
MSNILNVFSNFNVLTKNKSINDSALEYRKDKLYLNTPTPSLTQGDKFKNYQDKIKKNLAKQAKLLSGKEGFNGLNLQKMNLNPDGLAIKSNEIIKNNDYSSQQQIIDSLRQQYQDTLTEYENLEAQISGNVNGYINRVSSNNPYLGKNVCLSGGACGYVTNQGVFKWYPADNNYTYNNTAGKNGCPSTPYEQISGDGDVNNYGSTISSTPPLVVGTPMIAGQSCGNEGSNVFVNTLVINSTDTYEGCYNNVAPVTEVRFNPVMGSSNSANGYTANASSVYHNDNNFTGPWRAFDDNNATWWHSHADSDGDPYNNGNYVGNNSVSFTNANGQQVNIKGEFLQLNNPSYTPIPLVKYDLIGRLDCCGNPNGRDPNTWYILGRNTSDGQWYQVDYQSNISFNYQMKSFSIQNPKPYGAYIILITVAGDSNASSGSRGCVQISTWNLYTTSNYVTTPNDAMTNAGQMTFDQCQSYALTSGNEYFGMQGVGDDGIGNCMVSNTLAGSQIYGEGYVYNPISLWSSNTASSETSNPGVTATLSNTGSLVVFNASSSSVFSSDNSKATPGNYIGCYNDCWQGRALPVALTVGAGAGSTYETCQAAAQTGNWKYFGLQFTQPNGTSECWVGNDINAGRSMGKASNCTTAGGNPVGGSCSNAIYGTTIQTSYYFLILQDDGNMCVYRGTGPSDNQGTIWCSMTNGQQKEANPNFAASKGKYGKNWIASGATLATNDFIGSNDGSIYLIMQTDGNLVLYTNSKIIGCAASNAAGGKIVGQQNINSVYQINNMGNKNVLSQLAYIDQNAELHAYPSNNKKGNNSYSLVANGIDSAGNDIPGAAYGNATLEQCETTCNNNPDCGGFVMNGANNICWPKTPSFYPNGNIAVNSDRKIFIRGQAPISTPIGVSDTVKNVDSITYQNYINGGAISNKYGLANATAAQKQELSQLETRMNLLSNQISTLSGKFEFGNERANNQSKDNITGLGNYLTDLNNTDTKIKNFSTNFENILKDSDITVLQKNYDYLFWSILAAGTVLVSMNIVKK